MPETNESEVPATSQIQRKRNERTEARLLEDADKLIAEAERQDAAYKPPSKNAELPHLKTRRDAVLAARAANQANAAAEEEKRNARENLYKTLNRDVTRLVTYAKAAAVAENQFAALQSKAREVRSARAKPVNGDGGNRSSVSQMSFASRADNFAEFIEIYDALAIETTEDFYKAATQRAALAALREANAEVIAAESASNTSGETLDKLTYLDPDSLLNGCISGKNYIKSKYGVKGQPYLNIAKTRFELPTRLRRR